MTGIPKTCDMVFTICSSVLIFAGYAFAFSFEGCGRTPIAPHLETQDRILGGSEAIPGSWPWQAAVHVFNHVCGGALISDQHVLTAAHCTLYAPVIDVKVHLGSHTRNSEDEDEIWVPAEEICTHPNYRTYEKLHWINDLAIIKLSKKVKFTSKIQPVCLPSDFDELPNRSEVYVTGWGVTGGASGKSTTLKQLRTLSYTNERCSAVFSITVPDVILCGGHHEGSSCYGDSGGPVVYLRNDTWTLQGIVSGGPMGCGNDDEPLYFTKVSHYTKNLIDPYMKDTMQRPELRRICDIA
ncbi:chymotrypsinogen B-like [Ornithodoros turicata]|uniref:chymotrypsinogen B-like n=1 Tax=Ornithodoros turicata TaxID=34597 RepID=UPI003138FB55